MGNHDRARPVTGRDLAEAVALTGSLHLRVLVGMYRGSLGAILSTSTRRVQNLLVSMRTPTDSVPQNERHAGPIVSNCSTLSGSIFGAIHTLTVVTVTTVTPAWKYPGGHCVRFNAMFVLM